MKSEKKAQQGRYCDWQQAYDDTYGCFYYYCERTQETRWDPPAVSYLPTPLEWLPAHMQDSYAATHVDTPWQQQGQTVPAGESITQLDSQLSQHGSAIPLSNCTEQEATAPQHSGATPYARDASQIHAEVDKQHSTRSSFPIRPESSGLMSSIPQPQGTHLRFDTDIEHEQGCAKEPTAVEAIHILAPADQPASTGSPRNLGATPASSEHCSSAHHTDSVHRINVMSGVSSADLAQQAVNSILSSTVMTDEPLQQAAELSNIIPDGPTSTPHALQEMADTCCEALLPSDMHDEQHEAQQKADAVLPTTDDQHHIKDANGHSTKIDADNYFGKLAEDTHEEPSEAEGPGIVFQSLSNQLQSKRELPRKLWKYWLQRYSLFQKFDEGILMDEEGWYSATPEVIAAHQAERCRCSVVVDAFAGVGGNAIQFALTCDRVIAVELSAQRLEIAKHNAEVYGVAHKIQFICGDFLRVAPSLQADAVFLSPPWGGPAYSKSGLFDVAQSIGSLGQNLSQLIKTAATALRQPECQRIACFLPRNTSLVALSDSSNMHECLVERNILNGHFKAVTAYFGDLASAHGA